MMVDSLLLLPRYAGLKDCRLFSFSRLPRRIPATIDTATNKGIMIFVFAFMVQKIFVPGQFPGPDHPGEQGLRSRTHLTSSTFWISTCLTSMAALFKRLTPSSTR